MDQDHPDPRVGDRVRIAGTKSARNTGVVVAIKHPGKTQARFFVRPDEPTPAMTHVQEASMMRPPAPDITNPDDLWDCAAHELEVTEHGADAALKDASEVLHFESGSLVMYNGNPEDIWTIVKHEPDAKYAYCARGLTQDRSGRMIPTGKAKNIVAALLSPYISTRQAKKVTTAGPVVRREKKRKDNVGDGISDLLQEAETLDQLWLIAGLAGLDVPEIKTKIAHLNPGLQRMGIGNRLRTLHKRGQLELTLEQVLEALNRG